MEQGSIPARLTMRFTQKYSMQEIMVVNSTYSRCALKRRLLKEKVIPCDKCSVCGVGRVWNNKPLSLALDHINGIHNDHRKENLRFICPNCHSQTDTYAGKQLKTICKGCRIKKGNPNNPLCVTCNAISRRKANRPSKEELHKLVWEMPTTHIAKKFNVTDKAIHNWTKGYGITKPPRGYWQKLQYNKL